MQRWTYLLRCVEGWLRRHSLECPDCGSADYQSIKNKMWVTKLVRCSQCELLYRIPKDPPDHHRTFYQDTYESTLATHCPSPDELQRLLETRFEKTEKDFSKKIAVLRAVGVTSGQRILDFGASWGYGTWQFQQAGFSVQGYELSQPRARFAREKLHVSVVDQLDDIEGRFDVFFSSHVLEHLPSPRDAFELAKRVLQPGGLFVAYTPNGSEACLAAHPKKYHESWGRLHPLYLDDRYFRHQFPSAPILMASAEYGAAYPLTELQSWNRKSACVLSLAERELLTMIVM